MDERRVHIDEFFHRQMEGAAETPPPAVWETLEKRLDEKPGRKRIPIWWFWTIAGLIVISASVIIAGYVMNLRQPTAVNTTPAGSHNAIPSANRVAANTDAPASHPATDEKTTNNTGPNPANANSAIATKQAPTQSKPNQAISTGTPGPANAPASEAAQTAQQNPPAANMDKATAASQPPASVPARTPRRNNAKMFFLSAISSGIEFPTAIPAAPEFRKVTVPTVKFTAFEDAQAEAPIVSRRVAETDNATVPAPEMRVAMASPAAPPSALLPGLITPAEEQATANAETGSIVLQAASMEDTSKKKKLIFPDSASVAMGETTGPVDRTAREPLPIDIGLKLGYSSGFDNAWRGNKFILAPYFEYRLFPKFSLTLQPSFLVGNAKTGSFNNANSYYHEILNNTLDSLVHLSRGAIDSSVLTPNPPDTIFRTYRYGQVYDSIHVGYRVSNKQLWDIELPLIAKYKVSKNFALLLGGSVSYSSVLQTKEELTRYDGLSRSYDEVQEPQTFYTTYQGQQPPHGAPTQQHSALFPHSTTPFSSYQPRPTENVRNFFRYGVMVGGSATFNRWMVELMLHKTTVDTKAVPDKQLQKIYTQPYLRLMLGYKLTK